MLDTAPSHPKLRRLARELRIPVPWAVGTMAMLWIFTKEHFPAGDIGKADDVDIEEAVAWPVERSGELIPALLASKLLDECSIHRLIVHDWSTHCVPYIHAKLWRLGMIFADGKRPSPKRSDLKEGERPRFDEHLAQVHSLSTVGPVDNHAKSSGRPVDLLKKPVLKRSEKKGSESNEAQQLKNSVLSFPEKDSLLEESDPVQEIASKIRTRHPTAQKLTEDEIVRQLISLKKPTETLEDVAQEVDRNHAALCALRDDLGGWQGKEPRFIPSLRKWITTAARDPTEPPPKPQQLPVVEWVG